jgi:excinuclease ABC subunit C
LGEASLKEQLSSVPTSPGVYLWKDAEGDVLYVGKAKSLRSRMRSYLSPRHDDRPKIEPMMGQVASFDFVATESEVDSLILEANLIKQFRPPYNVDYRDDKSYPYIALTMSDPFPAIKYTRERHRKGTRYFGPYTDAKAARQTIEAVRRVYPICAATCAEWRRLARNGGEPLDKACFDHHVGRGPGACIGAISREEYADTVAHVVRFLEGRRSGLVAELRQRMDEAATDLDYEHAARLRNAIGAVEKVLERQTVVSNRPLDLDVIGLVREETIAAVHMLVVREGRVLAGNEFILDQGLDVPETELVEGFLLRHYGEASHVPKEVAVCALPDDPELFEEWLSGLRGSRVALRSPQRGEKRRLLEMADTNAGYALARYKHRTRYDEQRLNRALLELESALALSAPPMRVECYDISTLHGRHSVGSMVVFSAGRPEPAGYRRFRVRAETGEADDVAMLGEVLARRFARTEDGRFAKMPDLVIVDGGKPQLSAARAALDRAGVGVPIAALAKREEELFVPGWAEPVALPAGSASLHLVKRIRDEAHRFAVTYHRDLRSKAMTASVLDEVPGVGPKRKKSLLASFGSLKRLREASVDEVAAVPGIPRDVAEDVVATLRDAGGS